MKKIILLVGLVVPLSLLTACKTTSSYKQDSSSGDTATETTGTADQAVTTATENKKDTKEATDKAAPTKSVSATAPTTVKPMVAVNTNKINQAELGAAIHAYLISHPGILDEMIAARQKEQEINMQSTASKVASSIANDKNAPAVGSAQPKATVIEYFDYQCSACKAGWPDLKSAINNSDNKNVRFVFAELPFFPGSRYAAEVSLAAYKLNPEKFKAFHTNMMQFREKGEGTLTKQQVMTVANASGYETAAIKSYLNKNKTAIEQELSQNEKTFGKIGFRGTPSLVVMNNETGKVQVSPGVPNDLQGMINKAQKS